MFDSLELRSIERDGPRLFVFEVKSERLLLTEVDAESD